VLQQHALAEKARADLGVSGASDVAQQAPVARLTYDGHVDPEPPRQPHRDDRPVQAMFERETHPEIGREGQRRDHLRGTQLFGPSRRFAGHAWTLYPPVAQAGKLVVARRHGPRSRRGGPTPPMSEGPRPANRLALGSIIIDTMISTPAIDADVVAALRDRELKARDGADQ
jgi:hypothetical protein